ncbi:MAG: hypothetical protein K8R88_03755 [Armatimonadetes bacterium]|nr:hypothetical protein [Armatimonadota bacterium]
MSFEEWMKELDLLCWSNYGMSIHDLPDMCFRDAFDGEVTPLQFFHDELGSVDDLAKCLA